MNFEKFTDTQQQEIESTIIPVQRKFSCGRFLYFTKYTFIIIVICILVCALIGVPPFFFGPAMIGEKWNEIKPGPHFASWLIGLCAMVTGIVGLVIIIFVLKGIFICLKKSLRNMYKYIFPIVEPVAKTTLSEFVNGETAL